MEPVIGYEFRDVVKHDAFVDPLAAHVIKDPTRIPLLGLPAEDYFTKTSKVHGRSMEDPHGHVFTGEPVTDENNDIYTVFSIKGADASDPHSFYSDHEFDNVRVNGMLHPAAFPGVSEVSKLLRREGVLTEWPILHARPKTFPSGEGEVGLLAFKQLLYQRYIADQQANSPMDKRYLQDDVAIAGVVGEGLLDMKFSVMYRATLSGLRLNEFANMAQQGIHGLYLQQAITALQLRKPKHLSAWEDIAALNPRDAQDQARYFMEILPDIMGENLARLHNAGCFHKYPHSGNWTLAGEIVDLDSVRSTMFEGEDSEITTSNRLREAMQVARTFRYIVHPDNADDLSKAVMRSYFAERYGDVEFNHPESILLESQFYNFDSPDCDDLGKNRVLEPTTKVVSEGVAIFLVAAMKAPQKGELRVTLDDELLEKYISYATGIAEQAADDFFEKHGLQDLQDMFEEKLVRIEGQRLAMVILSEVEKFMELDLPKQPYE